MRVMNAFVTSDGVEVFDRPLGGPPPKSTTERRGGARPGSGPKTEGYVKPPESVALDKARARKEAANADLAELDVKIKTGQFGDRAQFRQAAATALASMVQTLRSIPDNLERKLGVAPEVAQEVGDQIDAALDELADEFEMMCSIPTDAES